MLYTWNLYNIVNQPYLSSKKGTTRPFPKMVVSFSNQYSMKVSVVLHSLHHLLLSIISFLYFSRYVGNVIWFQFAFPWWLVMLSSFACMCGLFTHSDIVPPLKYGLFPFLLISSKWLLHILHAGSLSNICLWVFYSCLACLFTLLSVYFDEQKF